MDDRLLYGDSRLPPEMQARVDREVRDREQLLWVGQPRPGRLAWAAYPIVLFGIFWTGFSLFWMAGAAGLLFGGPGFQGLDPFSICFPLFGLPFVFIGFGMLSAPYWIRQKAKNTCYALTDRRAIIWDAGFFGGVEVRSYGPADLQKLIRKEYGDGSGDLIFEEQVRLGRTSKGHPTTNIIRHGFLAIDNVRDIEELLRKALLPDYDSPPRQD